jgi:hypothetical protein
MAGHTEKPSEDANPLNVKQVSEMTLEELNAFLAKEASKRAADAKPIMDHVSPQSDANPFKDNDISERARPSEGHALLIEGSCVEVVQTDIVIPDAEGEP